MMRTSFALTAGVCLALVASLAFVTNPASAQKARDYGGPLYVGPNFEQGGQHAPPVYGEKRAKKRVTATPPADVPKVRKARATPPKDDAAPAAKEKEKEADTDQASTGVTPSTETESGAGTTGDTAAGTNATSDTNTTTGAATSAVNCKKFDSTAGQTITVPCE